MARRYTWPADKRTLPRRGRTRTMIRLLYVDTLVDEKTGLLMHGEIKGKDGAVVQKRSNRRTCRTVAFHTRRHNNGRMWGELPTNIQLWQNRIAATK